MFPARSRLIFVAPDQKVLKKVANKLESHVLECECRAVEELEEVQVLLLVEGYQRSDILCAEGGVARVDDALEVLGWDLGG